LYYAEAQALETAAGRTNLRPQKEGDQKTGTGTVQNVPFPGKTEAQSKVDELEKSI